MIEDNLKRILENIHNTALACNRDPSSILLLPITKLHPWNEIQPLYNLGLRQFGENRLQEAQPKIDSAPRDTTWHLVGHLQSNKVRSALKLFSLIHSVDSFKLAEKISQESNQTTNILLEVNTSQEPQKHGFSQTEALTAFHQILALPNINIQGLMTMAPLTQDESVIRTCFNQLRALRDTLESQHSIQLPHLSMGMSNDYQLAILEGATILRIGSALFT